MKTTVEKDSTTPKTNTTTKTNSQRDYNRSLTTDEVLARLRRWMPRQHAAAEIVGKWVWITFPEPPAEQIRLELSGMGFHWNKVRQCWQHPCGAPSTGSNSDPREKYGSRYATDNQPA